MLQLWSLVGDFDSIATSERNGASKLRRAMPPSGTLISMAKHAAFARIVLPAMAWLVVAFPAAAAPRK